MKKFLSLFCVLAIIAAFAVIPASAVEAAQTIIDVDPGDEVTYQLVLSDVDEKVVGCDFSVYYDSDAFDVTSVADFTNSTNEDDQRAMINADLDGEVIGNWSILRGVDFSDGGNIVTVNLKAKQAASTHISYYVRYLYPDSLQEFTKYTFTCNVTKNGSTVLENAKPELGENNNSDPGQFVNSVDGDSANAGQGAAAQGGSSGGAEPNENSGGGAGSGAGTSSVPANSATTATNSTTVNSPSSKAAGVETVVSTDAEGNEVITVISATPDQQSGGGSPALWIVLGVIVVAGVCVVIYFVKKKKTPDASAVSENNDIK